MRITTYPLSLLALVLTACAAHPPLPTESEVMASVKQTQPDLYAKAQQDPALSRRLVEGVQQAVQTCGDMSQGGEAHRKCVRRVLASRGV